MNTLYKSYSYIYYDAFDCTYTFDCTYINLTLSMWCFWLYIYLEAWKRTGKVLVLWPPPQTFYLFLSLTSGIGTKTAWKIRMSDYCPSPSSGEAYRDRRLTTNFELSFELKFFVCRHVSIWGFRNRVCLSVPREKKSPWLRQYQSYISIDTSMERSSRVLYHENPKSLIFSQESSKLNFVRNPRKEITLASSISVLH